MTISDEVKSHAIWFVGIIVLAVVFFMKNKNRGNSDNLIGDAATPMAPSAQQVVQPVSKPNTLFTTNEPPIATYE